MARAQFDRNEVIDKSIELFWHNGYSASSMQQVTQTTGLKPGSIYLAFGSKEGLFREALERYADRSIATISATIENSASVGQGIRQHLESVVQDTTRENFSSCFLIKTQLELAAEGNKLRELASANLGQVEALFQSYLEEEYNKEVSTERAASIMLHIFGMRIYGYQSGSAERMRLGLREGLPWLPWD